MEEVKEKERKKAINKKRSCKCPQCSGPGELDCFWKIENAIPEKYKPSSVSAYISVENINGIGYLKATEIDKPFDPEFLSWFLAFCVGKGINAFWKTNDVPFCIGSAIFVETAVKASGLNMI